MAAAAASTFRLRVATGVALVVERDPIQLAKALVTIDVLSSGRVDVGVGGGWNTEEMRLHGTDPRTRWTLLRERVQAVKTIWANDPAEYHGQFVDFEPVVSRPRPVQSGGPKVHIGGAGPSAYRRALRYADGWMPLLHRGDDDIVEHVGNLRREADAMERSLDRFEISVCDAPFDVRTLATYQAARIDRVLLRTTPYNPDRGLADLDRIGRLATQFNSTETT